MRPNESIKDSDVYDWIIDITLLTHVIHIIKYIII
jgi:hypothetical protein